MSEKSRNSAEYIWKSENTTNFEATINIETHLNKRGTIQSFHMSVSTIYFDNINRNIILYNYFGVKWKTGIS